jgi:hypothetical protein
MGRSARLRRQLAEIEQRCFDLPRSYLDRSRSDNVQVRMRGIALWIALVYHETGLARTPESEELHRQVLRIMRELKVFSSRLESGGGGASHR